MLSVQEGSWQYFRRAGSIFAAISFEPIALTPSLILLQAIEHETFAAVGNNILVYDRANIVRKYEHANAVVGMISVGKTLISYDVENNIKV